MNNTFCVLPWTHLCVRPDNVLKPCCRFLSDNPSNEFKTTLDDIYNLAEEAMNTDYFNSIRKNMLEGKKIAGCQKCYTQEENKNKPSMRQIYNNFINIDSATLSNNFYAVRYIEMSIDNICNLQCRMCDSKFSSKLQKRDKFLGNNVFKKLEPNFSKLTNLNLKELNRVKILGGEPFITPNFEKFIDFLTENSEPANITLDIATNGTTIPSKHIVKKLNQFKQIAINVSLDAYDKINDYQRYGSSYVKTINNSKTYSNILTNSILSYHVTVSTLNANVLGKTIEFFEREKVLYSLDFVRDPEYHSLLYTPKIFKEWILSENSANPLAYDLLKSFIFQKDHNLNTWEKFLDNTKKLDKYYNIKLQDYNVDLYNFIKNMEKAGL